MKKLHKFSFFVCVFVFFSCAASNIQKGERVVLNKMIEGKYFLDTKKHQRSKERKIYERSMVFYYLVWQRTSIF